MSVVAIRDLQFRYAGAASPALDGVGLEIEPGEFVVLAGRSGSGKSTLLQAISGLVPHFHGGEISGSVEVGGRSTRTHGVGELSATVGTLLQDPETQTILGTPRAELSFALENRGLGPAAIARAVEETALALAIEPLRDRPTDSLSGGELQRVALGATLSSRPAVVCLDEPTSQLDPVAGDELISLLRRLGEDTELTVLLAEHRLERCLPYADRVLALDRGRLVFDGAPSAFLAWAMTAAPALTTPGAALLSDLSLRPLAGVRAARRELRAAGYTLSASSDRDPHRSSRRSRRRVAADAQPALELERVWHELSGGPAILRGLSLSVSAGERVAVMGRNGAGKSTLLRHAAGLMAPTRGRVRANGRVVLLLQHPGDYLVHETVAEEADAAALATVGLAELAARHPGELSGGERQRLALATVLGGPNRLPPAVVCLDEPTRGMDRAFRHELVTLLHGLGRAAVIVATHDPELAAELADRVVLLADGTVIADGPAAEVLSGGTYFATETARILGGAGGALLPAQGAAQLRARPRPAITPAGVVQAH